MRAFNLRGSAFAVCAAVAILAGCSSGSSTIGSPPGVVPGSAGNLYVATYGLHAVYEMLAPSYTTINTLGGGFTTPSGVAVDGSGNVFVTDGNPEEIPVGCLSAACVITVASGFDSPLGVVVDGSENLFVTDTYHNVVKELLAPGYMTISTLGSGFSYPSGIALDESGNVFVVDSANLAVKEILKAGGYTIVNTLGHFSGPAGVAVDASENVYVANQSGGEIYEILAAGGTRMLASGLNGPTGVAVDGSGNVFVANVGNGTSGGGADEILAVGGSIPPNPTIITLAPGITAAYGIALQYPAVGSNVKRHHHRARMSR